MGCSKSFHITNVALGTPQRWCAPSDTNAGWVQVRLGIGDTDRSVQMSGRVKTETGTIAPDATKDCHR